MNTVRQLLDAARKAVRAHRTDIYIEPWADQTDTHAHIKTARESIDALEDAIEAFEAVHVDDGARK